MRVLLFFLLIANADCFSQTLKGKFLYEGFGDGGRTLHFKGNTFTDNTAGHDADLYGEGTYKISAKNLYLDYKKVKNQDSSQYTIQSKASKGKGAYLSLKTLEENGKPVRSMIVLADQNLQSIGTFYADKNGEALLDLPPNSIAKYIKILYWLHYRVTLAVAELLGKNTDITINFKPEEFAYKEPGRETYSIKDLTPNGFKLVGHDKQEYIFKKIE